MTRPVGLVQANPVLLGVWFLVQAASGPNFLSARQQPDTDRRSDSRRFAEDVVLHVVTHKLGHALIREFDIPILGNEETMADAFATHYPTARLPDRAAGVIEARTKSLVIEEEEIPRAEWSVSGEHNNDARRAYQIAALAIAVMPLRRRRQRHCKTAGGHVGQEKRPIPINNGSRFGI